MFWSEQFDNNFIFSDSDDKSTKKRLHDDEDDEIPSKQLRSESILDDIKSVFAVTPFSQLIFYKFSLESFASRIQLITLETQSLCTHEVAVPPDQEYQPLVQRTGSPAKTYKFTLDPFQEEAILCIENNQSVLVSAHTSAGKTVVAE